jgi:hypothetical protein
MKIKFSRFSKKKTLNIKFYQIRPVGVELFHADWQTDMMKLTVDFRNFANASKKFQVLER